MPLRQFLIGNANPVLARILLAFRTFGCIQLLLGAFVAIFNFGLLFIHKEYSFSTAATYSGFWTGPVFFAAGMLAFYGSEGGAKMLLFVIGCLILSTLSACLAAVALGLNISLMEWLSGKAYGYVFPFDIAFQIAFGLEILAVIVQIALGFKIYCSATAAGNGSGYQRQLDSTSDTVQSTAATPA